MIKNWKQKVDSYFIVYTALSMLFYPSFPLSARPGPNMDVKAEIMIVISPKLSPVVQQIK